MKGVFLADCVGNERWTKETAGVAGVAAVAAVANSGVLETLAVLPCVAPSMGAIGQENTDVYM